MTVHYRQRPGGDPWHGRQPRYDKLVRRGPTGYAMVTRLPSGQRVDVPLGRLTRKHP